MPWADCSDGMGDRTREVEFTVSGVGEAVTNLVLGETATGNR
jgi:hypothetical protein